MTVSSKIGAAKLSKSAGRGLIAAIMKTVQKPSSHRAVINTLRKGGQAEGKHLKGCKAQSIQSAALQRACTYHENNLMASNDKHAHLCWRSKHSELQITGMLVLCPVVVSKQDDILVQ